MEFMRELLLTMGMAALPVVELRGSIPFGAAMGLPLWTAFGVSLLGNMLPVPFLILFVRKVFRFLSARWDWLGRQIEKLEKRTMGKAAMVYRYKLLGLCLLVAIPLPGTGAWTGALLAALMDLRLKTALPAIFLGVVIAGVLVSLATYGISALAWAM